MFRHVDKSFRPGDRALSDRSAALIVKRAAAHVGLDVECLGVFEEPLARLRVLPMQLMVLARRPG